MTARISRRYLIVLAVVAASGAAHAQTIYVGPGVAILREFWNPQVYGPGWYVLPAPGPYVYGYLSPPLYILPPLGYVPQPYPYGYYYYPPPVVRPQPPIWYYGRPQLRRRPRPRPDPNDRPAPGQGYVRPVPGRQPE
jgi:hypothetical protein